MVVWNAQTFVRRSGGKHRRKATHLGLARHFGTGANSHWLDFSRHPVPGSHGQLAYVRRECEALAASAFVGMGLRYRDVGGSRLRDAHQKGLKHLCAPQLGADDVLRDAKVPTPKFDMCRNMGSKCPQKLTFPGAMLTYTDLYMSLDELSGIVRSHTFILTHNFEGTEGKLLGEAEWKTHPNGMIEMSSDAGTTYRHHRHVWGSEGHVVGKHGAFTYERIGEVGGTLLLYAYPSPGKYAAHEINGLKRSKTDCTAVRNGAEVYRTAGLIHYLGPEDNETERERHALPSPIVDMAVGKFANVPNDIQRIQAMTQYVRSKMEAEQVAAIPAHAIDSICRAMNRRHLLLCGSYLDYNYDAANR